MVSSIVYNGDGTTRIFPVDFKILGDNFVRVYVDGVEVTDKRKYDIINNSIVFTTNETPPIGEGNVQIYVATSESELGDLGAPLTDITIVAQNIADINAVGQQVVPNLPEILLADDNATIATQKALEASNSATSASESATIATTKAGEASTSANNASTSEANALAYRDTASTHATTATTQAGIATAKAGEALTSANNASTSEANALAYRDTASTHATTATTQAGIATTKAGEASASATSASDSASQALGYRNEALSSATLASGYKDTTYLYLEDAQEVQLEISTRRHEGEYISMDSSNEDFGDVLLSSPFSIENNTVNTDLAVSFGTLDCGSTI
jgi:hypothetical protein